MYKHLAPVSLHTASNWMFLVQCIHATVHGVLLLGFILYQFAQPFFLNSEVWVVAYWCLFASLSLDFIYFYFHDQVKKHPLLCSLFLLFDSIWMTICLSGAIPVLYSILIFVYLLQIASAGLIGGYKWAFVQGLWVSALFSWVLIFFQPSVYHSLTIPFALNNIAFILVAGLSGFLGQELKQLNWFLSKASVAVHSLSHLNKRIVSSINMGLFILDENLNILHTNEAAKKTLKLDAIHSLTPVHKLFPKLKEVILSQQFKYSKHFETHYGKGNDKKNIEIFISPFKESNTLAQEWWTEKSLETNQQKYLILFQDCTYMRTIEQKMKEKEKFSAIGKMAAGIAHEIRNPLSSISGSIQLLDLENKHQSENKRLMGITLSEISRLNRIISDFLDYTIDEKSIAVDNRIQTLSVNSLLEELLDYVRVNSKWGHITHHFTLQSHGLIQASSDRLKQIFLNVVKNACEAMEKQAKGHLEITSFDDNEWVVVQIKDNGHGIHEKELPYIFNPFYSKKQANQKGTGLGLSIAHKLVTAYGGHISFQNRNHVESNHSSDNAETNKDNLATHTGTICTIRFPIQSSFVPEEMAQRKSA